MNYSRYLFVRQLAELAAALEDATPNPFPAATDDSKVWAWAFEEARAARTGTAPGGAPDQFTRDLALAITGATPAELARMGRGGNRQA